MFLFLFQQLGIVGPAVDHAIDEDALADDLVDTDQVAAQDLAELPAGQLRVGVLGAHIGEVPQAGQGIQQGVGDLFGRRGPGQAKIDVGNAVNVLPGGQEASTLITTRSASPLLVMTMGWPDSLARAATWG